MRSHTNSDPNHMFKHRCCAKQSKENAPTLINTQRKQLRGKSLTNTHKHTPNWPFVEFVYWEEKRIWVLFTDRFSAVTYAVKAECLRGESSLLDNDVWTDVCLYLRTFQLGLPESCWKKGIATNNKKNDFKSCPLCLEKLISISKWTTTSINNSPIFVSLKGHRFL